MRPFLLFALVSVSAPALAAGEPAAVPAEGSPATVRVTLPADARLTIDGQTTQSTSAQRQFITPPLDAGKRYSYLFRASFVRPGQTITVEQVVFVRAGRETLVSLDAAAEASGTDSSRGGSVSWYASSDVTRVYYGAPEPPASPQAGPYPVPSRSNGERGPREGQSYVPPSKPVHWGTDPSDPFYHSGQ
jgi:uncharacterized protein (TIGR03000 family)